MDYLFSQHDLSFLDDVIPEKDKKKKEDEKKKKKKKGSLDSDNDDVRNFPNSKGKLVKETNVKIVPFYTWCEMEGWVLRMFIWTCGILLISHPFALYILSLVFYIFWSLSVTINTLIMT